MAVEWKKLAFDTAFSGAGTSGLVPDPTAETGKFLKDDGTWAAAGGDTSGLVPYTGANANVNLGNYYLLAKTLKINVGDLLTFNADDASDTSISASATKLSFMNQTVILMELFAAYSAFLEPIKLKERAASIADTGGYSQVWAKNTAPSQLWHTDDAGNEFEIFKPAYFNAYRTDSMAMPTANVWQNLPFNIPAKKRGFVHNHVINPEQIKITAAGVYRIAWRVGFVGGGNHSFQMRLMNSGTEVPGSYSNVTISYRDSANGNMIESFHADDVLKVQVTSLQSNQAVNYYDGGADPTTWVTASICIDRVE